jgi:DNA-binding CsgD family transcriptional regulator
MASLALVSDQAQAAPAATQHAVMVVDDRRRCVEANDPACELIGLGRDRIVGRRFESFLVRGMRDRVEHVWKAFADGGGHAGPFTLASGPEVQISMTQNLMPGRHLLLLTPVAARAVAPPAGGLAEGQDEAKSPPRRPPRAPSAREREVLKLLATGATDPQIAGELGLSPATVQTHVRNVKTKLGARTRAHAVALGLERGLIQF